MVHQAVCEYTGSEPLGVDRDVGRRDDEHIAEVDHRPAGVLHLRGELGGEVGERALDREHEDVAGRDGLDPLLGRGLAVEDPEHHLSLPVVVDLLLDGPEIEVEVAHGLRASWVGKKTARHSAGLEGLSYLTPIADIAPETTDRALMSESDVTCSMAAIVRDESIRSGDPRIDGTRITVIDVKRRIIDNEEDPHLVAGEYDVSMADLFRALTYYYEHREELEGLERAASVSRSVGEARTGDLADDRDRSDLETSDQAD